MRVPTIARRLLAAACAGAMALGAAACGSSDDTSGTQSGGGSAALANVVTTTPAASGPIDQVTWDLPYGEPQSLDPLKSYGLPENTVFANVCDSLMRIGPDLTLQPGIASAVSQPDPSTYVFTIRSGVKFWDGKPLTPADVAFSLNRHIDPKNASYYGPFATALKSAAVTGKDQVTLKLTQPNELIKSMMASALGGVTEEAFTKAKGANYGTPKGGIMCSGPFELKSWDSGQQMTLTRNPDYWDSSLEPKADTLVFKFITDPAAITNGLLTGELDGSYEVPVHGVPQLESSDAGKVYYGKSLITSSITPLNADGALGDEKVRKALSFAIDRTGIAKAVYLGHATPSSWWVGPDSFGYERDQWQAEYDREALNGTPQPDKAKALLDGNPKAGSPITIAIQAGDETGAAIANEVQSAGKQVGLDVRVKSEQPTQFINLIFDAKSRVGIDAYIGPNGYLDMADPLEWVFEFSPKDSIFNFLHLSDPQQETMLNKALATGDEHERMQYAIPAVRLFASVMPVIPLVAYPERMFMSKRITGAPTSFPTFVYYPWAASIGAAG